MPSKTPLTLDQWLIKCNATMPTWWLEDAEHSVIRSHFIGLAAVMQALEHNMYQHMDEAFLTRCSDDTIDVYAAERLVPELGYTGESRHNQVREMRSRMHLDGIRERVSLLLDDPTVEVIDGYATGFTVIDAGYNDNEAAVISWAAVKNFFSVVVAMQNVPSSSFTDRANYADRAAFASTADTGADPVTAKIKNVVDHYKASGFLYRIFQRS